MLEQNIDKVFEKNHGNLMLSIPELGFGIKNFSSVISFKKNLLNAPPELGKYRVFLENSLYYNLSKSVKIGVYSRNKISKGQIGDL